MQRSIAYIRVSDPRQVDQGNSLQTQEKQVRAFAEAKSYQLDHIYVEEGESAKTDARPRLQEMLRWCSANKGKTSVLIVPKIDRLARHSFDYSSIKMTLAKSGVRIESVGERIEDSPVGRFTESIMASVAQFDNEMRSERSKGGMMEAVIEGRWVWKAPKGYQNVRIDGKGTIEPHPIQSKTIRYAFERMASGKYSMDWVRSKLSEEGVVLSRPLAYRMLRNKVYIGHIEAFGKVYQGSPPFVPIVSDDTFYGAQARLKQHGEDRRYQKQNPDFPLRGTIRCTCGRTLTGCFSKGKFSRYAYYRCLSCKNANYRREQVESAFLKELEQFRMIEARWSEVASAVRFRSSERGPFGDRDHQQLRREIKKMRDLQGSLALKNASGVIPDALAKTQIEELTQKIDGLSEKVHEPRLAVTVDDLLEFGQKLLANVSQIWRSSSIHKQQSLQKAMFPEGLVYSPPGGFRTPDNPLLGALNGVLFDDQSSLVDLNSEITKEFLDWTLRLYEILEPTASLI